MEDFYIALRLRCGGQVQGQYLEILVARFLITDKNSAAAGEGFRASGALLAVDYKGDLIGRPALDKQSLTVGVPVGKFHAGVYVK